MQQQQHSDKNNKQQLPLSSEALLGSDFQYCCNVCYDPKTETLEYNYTHDDAKAGGPQAYPRIRERGELYIDSYNDQPWGWTFGTHEKVGNLN